MVLGWVLTCTVAVLGCLQSSSSLCDDGGVCGPGQRCAAAGDHRICVDATCGDGVLGLDEACDDGNNVSGDGCPANCGAPCSDGVIDPGERCDDGNRTDGDGCDHDCTITACGNGIVTAGEACDDGNAIDGDGCDNDCSVSALAEQAYVKASNTGDADVFGAGVALSSDGETLAVGAPGEASAIEGDQTSDAAPDAGAVYVFTRHGARWRQAAYLKARHPEAGDRFGASLVLSADGTTLVVGAPGEANRGAVHVFTGGGTAWRDAAELVAANLHAGDGFGGSVALSADLTRLAVGAAGAAKHAGAVYVFARAEDRWAQEAYLEASNLDAQDEFGARVALSGDGAILAVAAAQEDGAGDDPSSNAAVDAGAVYVFTRQAAQWSPPSYLKASNPGALVRFGSDLALSVDGETLVVGCEGERGAAAGVDGDQADAGLTDAGAAYVFARLDSRWIQRAYLKPNNPRAGAQFGGRLAVSADGARLVIGARGEDSAATGIDGDSSDHAAPLAGAAYLFARDAGAWRQSAYLKAPHTRAGDLLGGSVALSGDGVTFAVGAPGDSSSAAGIDGSPRGNDPSPSSGAVLVFH